ncbi:AAA family ATPase [Patescibacteria group bacterium]|nr:AAA family ATPase [Patescibacteria group bacterium]
MNKFTFKAQEAIQAAHNIAMRYNQQQVDILHLALALLKQEEGVVLAVLKKMEANLERIEKKIVKNIETLPKIKSEDIESGLADLYVTQLFQKAIIKANKEARHLKNEYVGTEHLFLALLSTPSPLKDMFLEEKINYENVVKVLESVHQEEGQEGNERGQYSALKKYTINLTEMARQEKLDPIIGRDDEIRRVIQVLSRRTKNNPVLIGEAGVGKTAIAEGLAQRIISNDIPESLRGRELISLDLGGLIAGAKFRGEFENRLKSVLKEIKKSAQYILFIDELHTLVGAGGAEGSIDASNMLKPALARGELHCVGATTLKEYQKYIEKDAALERRFQPVQIKEPSPEDTIAILRGIKEKYEVHHGIRIADDALIAAAQLSHRYITDRFLPDKAIDLMDEAASALRLEIESQPEELDRIKRKLRQIEIEITILKKDKDSKDKLRNLKKQAANLKEKINEFEIRWKTEKDIITNIHKAKEEIDHLKQKAEIAEREGSLQKVAEIKYGEIPSLEKKIKNAEKKLAKIQKDSRILKEEISAEEIAKVVSTWTGIPVTKMLEKESKKLVKMEKEIHKKFIDQEEAVSAVANAIRRSRAGIAEEDKPIGSFIFLGPSGVGKTELAKRLAEFLFNTENSLIRLDMSEYMERHTASKIIGSPPGYVGHEEGGQLTEMVRRRPYSVILLDEIEKAHPQVFNILLQILDEGHLTDAKGREVNFKNTVIIMTSNLGSELIRDYAQKINFGFLSQNEKNGSEANIKNKIQEALREKFKPEFLNRIDEIIIFHVLDKKAIRQIVNLQLKLIIERLKSKNIKLQVSGKVKTLLVSLGFDSVYGARPLKRVIQKQILDPLALQIVNKDEQSFSSFKVDAKNEKIVIQQAKK